MKPRDAKKFAEGLFQRMQIISDYLKEGVFDMVGGVMKKSPRESSFHGLLTRVVCLMMTLRKCDQSTDFQTIAQANRALLELATDFILLHHDKHNGYLKMRAWEESAKLKGAEKVVRYYEERGKAIPEHFLPQKAFVDSDKVKVEQQRSQFWPKKSHQKSHPDRWTGLPLSQNVKDADALEGTNLTELYCTEYQCMNWMTHGSGLTGIRHMEPSGFMNLCGLSYAACGRLALLCAKIALKEFGFWDVYRDRWDEVNERIEMHMAGFLPDSCD